MKKIKTVICLMLAMLLSIAALSGCNAQPKTGPSNETQGGTEPPIGTAPTTPTEPTAPLVTAPEDEPYVEPPTAPPVEVKLPSYEMSYSGDMAEIISWDEDHTTGKLSFFVQIEGARLPIFTVLIDQITGENVYVKQNGKGEDVYVSYVMEAMPEGLSEENQRIFGTAQELVNDINASLVLK